MSSATDTDGRFNIVCHYWNEMDIRQSRTHFTVGRLLQILFLNQFASVKLYKFLHWSLFPVACTSSNFLQNSSFYAVACNCPAFDSCSISNLYRRSPGKCTFDSFRLLILPSQLLSSLFDGYCIYLVFIVFNGGQIRHLRPHLVDYMGSIIAFHAGEQLYFF